MTVTIKDVAQAAGVSITTVSRVLSNKGSFYSEKTARKVKKTAEKLGYQKNTAAAELATQKSKAIGVVINSTQTNFSNSIIEGIQQEANEHDLSAIIVYAGVGDAQMQHRAIQTVIERSVKGILLLSVDVSTDDLALLNQAQIPYISLSQAFTDEQISYISSNDLEIGYQATSYLLNKGHRKIGLAGIAVQKNAMTGRNRLAGYEKALAEAGIKPLKKWIQYGDYSYDAGIDAMKKFGEHSGMTAVVAASDMVGIGLLNQAHDYGIAVPDDLSIISIDGTDLCKIVQPQLTSVTQAFFEMGVEGVRALESGRTTKFTSIKIEERGSVKPM